MIPFQQALLSGDETIRVIGEPAPPWPAQFLTRRLMPFEWNLHGPHEPSAFLGFGMIPHRFILLPGPGGTMA